VIEIKVLLVHPKIDAGCWVLDAPPNAEEPQITQMDRDIGRYPPRFATKTARAPRDHWFFRMSSRNCIGRNKELTVEILMMQMKQGWSRGSIP
jgi:hypothetical protein